MPENSFEEQEISVTRLRLSDFFMTVQCIRNKSEDKDKRKKRKMDSSEGQLICLYAYMLVWGSFVGGAGDSPRGRLR